MGGRDGGGAGGLGWAGCACGVEPSFLMDGRDLGGSAGELSTGILSGAEACGCSEGSALNGLTVFGSDCGSGDDAGGWLAGAFAASCNAVGIASIASSNQLRSSSAVTGCGTGVGAGCSGWGGVDGNRLITLGGL